MSTAAARSKQVSGKLTMRNSQKGSEHFSPTPIFPLIYGLCLYGAVSYFAVLQLVSHIISPTYIIQLFGRVRIAPALWMKKPTPRKLSNLPKVTLVVAEPGLEDPAPEFVLLYFHVCFLRGDLPHHRPPHPWS